ncbi:MAG: hypothetical protein ACI87E_003264 [Mariniblastus sp.]|jgi:hypothetical protein
MMSDNPGLIEALEPVAGILQAMDVGFYIGGSVASSFHGASRSTMDVDLVADLKVKNVDQFVSRLQGEYYISKAAINDAIARLSCFNLIHLPSSFKVDIFILKNRPFDINSMKRAKFGKIDSENDFEFPIASPEDTILSKLEWYRLGNEVSERQWEDVARVMKILGDQADSEYLVRNAAELKVSDLLQRLLDSII